MENISVSWKSYYWVLEKYLFKIADKNLLFKMADKKIYLAASKADPPDKQFLKDSSSQ